jgi:cytochrome P450
MGFRHRIGKRRRREIQWRAMWDRFSQRLRKVIIASLDEAASAGLESAGPTHILQAILGDPQTGGMFVLRECGLTPERVRAICSSTAHHNSPSQHRASGIDEPAMQLLRDAAAEAERLSTAHIGTEHLIVVLARPSPIPLAQKLQEMGLTANAADAAIGKWLADGALRANAGQPAKMTSLFRRVIRLPWILWCIYVRRSLGHPRFVDNPYPIYRWLREHEPVRKDPLAPVWIVSGYEQLQFMLRDTRLKKDPFETERLPKLAREQLNANGENWPGTFETVSMLFLDPPRHTRVRNLFSRAFTPKNLADLAPRIEQIAAARLDLVAGKGQMDLIADLAYPLPVVVIAELLGFPPEDYAKIKSWSDDFTASLALNARSEHHAKAAQSREEIRAYFDGVVTAVKAHPRDTLLSRLLEAEGEPESLNREEIFANSVLLLAAGHETTTNLIGNGMLALLRHPNQWKLLTQRPELIESAVEEMLRYDSPVQWTSRVPSEPIEIAGVTIPAGEIILGSVGAANRDPRKFADPDRFDIQRQENKHLSFGTGIHFCLGAALARMEAQIAVRLLAQRFPGMKLAARQLKWMPGLTFRGVLSLRVEWDQ